MEKSILCDSSQSMDAFKQKRGPKQVVPAMPVSKYDGHAAGLKGKERRQKLQRLYEDDRSQCKKAAKKAKQPRCSSKYSDLVAGLEGVERRRALQRLYDQDRRKESQKQASVPLDMEAPDIASEPLGQDLCIADAPSGSEGPLASVRASHGLPHACIECDKCKILEKKLAWYENCRDVVANRGQSMVRDLCAAGAIPDFLKWGGETLSEWTRPPVLEDDSESRVLSSFSFYI